MKQENSSFLGKVKEMVNPRGGFRPEGAQSLTALAADFYQAQQLQDLEDALQQGYVPGYMSDPRVQMLMGENANWIRNFGTNPNGMKAPMFGSRAMTPPDRMPDAKDYWIPMRPNSGNERYKDL